MASPLPQAPNASTAPGHRSRAAFQYRDFRYFELARLFAILGLQMQAVAIGYQVYDVTGRTLLLGYIGLVQFIPNVAFALVTGHTADRFDRLRVVQICQIALVACSGLLAFLTMGGIGGHDITWMFVLLFVIGTANAFLSPASSALLPLIVPAKDFSNAVAWNSSAWQLATIAGPCLGGVLYTIIGPAKVYLIAAILTLLAFLFISRMKIRTGRMDSSSVSWGTVLAGVRYVFQEKVILGCISLDLFAVLLGGAVALLPVYAKDILHIGPTGLGMLRAAPAIGATIQAVAAAHLPPFRRAGATMLWAVAGFGIATVIFGLSRNFYLSLVCLIALGALDMVSIIVRHTLVQVLTPRAMQGRVNAVNMVFVGASNELGEFESGVTAHWWGATPAVVVGGVGTILVVALWAMRFPAMRRIGRLDELRPIDLEEAEGGPVI